MKTCNIEAIYMSMFKSPINLVIKRKLGGSKTLYEVTEFKVAIHLFKKVIETLHSEIPTFLCSFEALDAKTFKEDRRRKKRYISKNKNDLNPDRQYLTDTYSYQKNGYWIGTNIGRKEIIGILLLACESCAVEFSFANRIKIE